jgi:hypothetical protein
MKRLENQTRDVKTVARESVRNRERERKGKSDAYLARTHSERNWNLT